MRTNSSKGQAAIFPLIFVLGSLLFIFLLFVLLKGIFSFTFSVAGSGVLSGLIAFTGLIVFVIGMMVARPTSPMAYIGATMFGLGLCWYMELGFFFPIFIVTVIWIEFISHQFGPAPGAVMVVIALVLLFIMATGWGDIIETKTSDVATTVEANVPLDAFTAKISSFFSNIGLLMTNPQAWYENQYVKKGTRDEGATPLALEVTKIDILPDSVAPGETVSIVAAVENKGQSEAQNVFFSVIADHKIVENGGRVLNGDKGSKEQRTQNITDGFIPGDSRFFDADIKAPICSGTFIAKASVRYDYSVVASTRLVVMERGYYDELRRQNKLTPKPELSTSAAGPFKITLQADRNQPLPIAFRDDPSPEDNTFKVILGIVNDRIGTASIDPDLTQFYLPQELDTDDATKKNSECPDLYPTGERKDDFRVYKIMKGEDGETASGKDLNEIESGEVRAFTCKVRYNSSYDPYKFTIQKTLAVQANVSYTYAVTKKSSFTVKQLGVNLVPKCEDTATASQEYVQDLQYSCGPNEQGPSGSDAGLFTPIVQDPHVLSTQDSFFGTTCTIYQRTITRDKAIGSATPPINYSNITCLANEVDQGYCESIGMISAVQNDPLLNDLKSGSNLQSGSGTGACHICYTRGTKAPLTNVRVAVEQPGYQRASDPLDLEGINSHGYFWIKHGTDLPTT